MRGIPGAPVPSVRANGVTLAYRELGTGPPLILVNGFASTMDMWNPPVLYDLAKTFTVVIFDNRGTGYSSSSDRPRSISLFADDAAALMDGLRIPRAHILGLSMGASIAQELALSHPDRVDRLVLVSGTCGGKEAVGAKPEVWKDLSDKRGTPQEIAARMFSVLFPGDWLSGHDPWDYCPEVKETTSPESASRQREAFFAWKGSFDRLPEIRAPALILTGTGDVVIPPENSRILAGRIPGARLVLFPGAGHGLMYQCPAEFSRVVSLFLGGG
jgi:pimeloyl-ACP methyl ester carboxylesterase